jgi:hypothetical protein
MSVQEPMMSAPAREKFASQASPEVLSEMRRIAAAEGRQVQAVLDETLREYIERKHEGRPRRRTMDTFAVSLAEFDGLYRKLAK